MRIASWNIRYDVKPDNIPLQDSLAALPDPLLPPGAALVGEQPWSARRVAVARTLFAAQVDLIGLQEALIWQVRDVAELLGSDYAWVGVGREDGVSAGEFSPIFYRRSALSLIATDTFWLSQAPFKPGSWFPGAGTPRLATTSYFRLSADAGTGTGTGGGELLLLNTHLDHVSDAQRRLGAAMLLHRARHEAHAKPGILIFVTGDFNSSAKGDDEGAYAVLTGAQKPPPVPEEFARRFPLPTHGEELQLVMRDVRVAAPRMHVGGEWATFTGFKRRKKDEACIDFVFGRSGGGWEAKNVFVYGNSTDDGMLSSDHRLVVADVELP